LPPLNNRIFYVVREKETMAKAKNEVVLSDSGSGAGRFRGRFLTEEKKPRRWGRGGKKKKATRDVNLLE